MSDNTSTNTIYLAALSFPETPVTTDFKLRGLIYKIGEIEQGLTLEQKRKQLKQTWQLSELPELIEIGRVTIPVGTRHTDRRITQELARQKRIEILYEWGSDDKRARPKYLSNPNFWRHIPGFTELVTLIDPLTIVAEELKNLVDKANLCGT
jgi:hypothetical protein